MVDTPGITSGVMPGIDIKVIRNTTMLDSISQWDINEHLSSVGIPPEEEVWDTMVADVLPLMKRFLEYGGEYERPNRHDDNLPKKLTPSKYKYPIPIVRLIYGNGWLLITRDVKHGYPVIKLRIMSTWDYDSNGDKVWDTFLVHPNHLDAVLFHIFEIPNSST